MKCIGIGSYFKKIFTLTIVMVCAIMVLSLSGTVKTGIQSGLNLCFESVLPSLFLFTIISLFVVYAGYSSVLGKLSYFVIGKPLDLNAEQSAVYVMSFLSGYPVGAKLVSSLYTNQKITLEQAQRQILFSINAGPAFILVAVGEMTLNSRQDGVRLLVAHIASSIILAVMVRFFIKYKCKTEHTNKSFTETNVYNLSDSFVIAVTEAAKTMFSVCSFVVLFSAIGACLSKSSLPENTTHVLKGLLEVTVGVQGCNRNELVRVAFFLGFGGISVIFQVLSVAKNLKIKAIRVVVAQIIRAGLSLAIIMLLEKLFPRSVDTISFSQGVQTAAVHNSPVAAIFLCLLSVVLIVFVEQSKKTSAVDR